MHRPRFKVYILNFYAYNCNFLDTKVIFILIETKINIIYTYG